MESTESQSHQPTLGPEATRATYSSGTPSSLPPPRRPSQESGKSWDEGSQQAARASAATPGLTSVPTSVGDLMAPGSEHLQQMRESLAVGNGRRGGSEKPLPSAHLSAAVLDARGQRLPRGRGVHLGGAHGAGRPGTSLPGGSPRLGRCALLSINIDTNTGEVCGSLHKATLAAVRGFYTSGRLDEGLSGPDPQASDHDGTFCTSDHVCTAE